MPKHPQPLPPEQVIPRPLAEAVAELSYWFVIGGHAVRCFAPYRPSVDVDFGVREPSDLQGLLGQLQRSGTVQLQEQSPHAVHLTWNGINVSVFVLDKIAPHVEGRRLSVTGILATKLHAILDRGTRRDFFDLYVMLQQQRLGIAECLRALREVNQTPVDDGLLLRALSYFDDAEREAALPGEGKDDWAAVKEFLLACVGSLITPPRAPLQIQKRRVGVTAAPPKRAARPRKSPKR